MEENLKSIESQCGISPVDVSLKEIASDPNYVFLNDPNFATVVLYDQDGNIINVNSWIECAHYVNGGWSSLNSSNIAGDQIVFSGLLVLTFFYVFLKKRYFADGKS
tara:strand:- start:43 stop:360 length:318 start_codon:yes stop_codon:yes gene_type:complete